MGCIDHRKTRPLFSDVDHMITSIKKVFLKAPSRIQIFIETKPNLPRPPQPIIIQCGTRVETVKYYAINFKKIDNVSSKLTLFLPTFHIYLFQP